MILRRRDDYARVLRKLGGELFVGGHVTDNYFQCGKPAKAFLPREGISFACVLAQNHDGPCAHGGTCFKHGAYVGDRCPSWPDCANRAPTATEWDNAQIIADGIAQHIRTAPDREREALRRANIRQACHAR